MAAAFEESKGNEIDCDSPVEIFSLCGNDDCYRTSSSAWLNISGCDKEIVVGEDPIYCEIMGHGTGHNGKSNRGGSSAFDFGININGSIHDNALGKGLAVTHLDIWSNLTCHWVQQLKPNTTNKIQLQIRSRDNSSPCAIWAPYLIIKLFKRNKKNEASIAIWRNIDNIETNKEEFNIDYEYRLSTGIGNSTITPFKVSKKYLYYYDIVEDSENEGDDEDEFIIAKIKYDNKSKILSNNKNYQRYVRVNRIQYKLTDCK